MRGADALPGSAAAISLPDASFDAVVTVNAMHWWEASIAQWAPAGSEKTTVRRR
ncbi:methyltransferase domain-containing protein [Actinopolymorpha pittospori]|uniref:methyltransferase domain-containing protein n=1 Tax=Actinopolymorpha pittospori TaxID=648752 RepID=UPI003B58B249